LTAASPSWGSTGIGSAKVFGSPDTAAAEDSSGPVALLADAKAAGRGSTPTAAEGTDSAFAATSVRAGAVEPWTAASRKRAANANSDGVAGAGVAIADAGRLEAVCSCVTDAVSEFSKRKVAFAAVLSPVRYLGAGETVEQSPALAVLSGMTAAGTTGAASWTGAKAVFAVLATGIGSLPFAVRGAPALVFSRGLAAGELSLDR
jgi:hypothetical protein